jgi:hypothetical protein
VFTASIADINKALAVKQHTDLRKKIPACFHEWLDVTDRKRAELLPLARGIGIDHAIKLEKDDSGREKEVP